MTSTPGSAPNLSSEVLDALASATAPRSADTIASIRAAARARRGDTDSEEAQREILERERARQLILQAAEQSDLSALELNVVRLILGEGLSAADAARRLDATEPDVREIRYQAHEKLKPLLEAS